MRYIVHHLSHMPTGGRFCVSRLKIVPGFDGGPIEVHDGAFEPAYYPNRKEAAQARETLSSNAHHPVYGLRQLGDLSDTEVAEWLHQEGKAPAAGDGGDRDPAEDIVAWFKGLSEELKTLHRVEFMNAQPSARRLAIEKLLGVDLSALASVADMARSHVDDIREGLDDGTYDVDENKDIDQKVDAVAKLQGFIAANL